jgi:hypothetical protein
VRSCRPLHFAPHILRSEVGIPEGHGHRAVAQNLLEGLERSASLDDTLGLGVAGRVMGLLHAGPGRPRRDLIVRRVSPRTPFDELAMVP